MVNSILILAVIVLPGWISVSVAQRYHPRVVERTALMLWGMQPRMRIGRAKTRAGAV